LDTENVQKKQHRIALIASEHTFSQYPVFLKHLLIGLADESIPVALVCPQSCNVESLVIGAIEVIRHPVLELPFVGHFNNKLLIDKLIKFKPTIMHCLCESQAAETKHLAESLNLPYILMVNSLHKRFLSKSAAAKGFHVSRTHCKKIITPTASIADNIAKTYPNYSSLVQHVNQGTFVAAKAICFSQPSNYTTMMIAYPSHFCDKIENIFSSIRRLKIDGYEFMIFLISSDSMYPKLSFFTKRSAFPSEVSKTEYKLWKMLNAFDLAQYVTMVPRQMPWRKVLAAGDIFIYPDTNYIFNSLLLEAMSVGTAIAAFCGGVDDLIIPDETAVVLENYDEPVITQTLLKLIGRPEFARQIAKNAQQYVKKNHSVSNMIAQILQIYNDAGC
jgi:glycosyltransferase involved in cell wall biosynthesis